MIALENLRFVVVQLQQDGHDQFADLAHDRALGRQVIVLDQLLGDRAAAGNHLAGAEIAQGGAGNAARRETPVPVEPRSSTAFRPRSAGSAARFPDVPAGDPPRVGDRYRRSATDPGASDLSWHYRRLTRPMLSPVELVISTRRLGSRPENQSPAYKYRSVRPAARTGLAAVDGASAHSPAGRARMPALPRREAPTNSSSGRAYTLAGTAHILSLNVSVMRASRKATPMAAMPAGQSPVSTAGRRVRVMECEFTAEQIPDADSLKFIVHRAHCSRARAHG